MEIAFSFDTTFSMSSYLDGVRGHLQNIVTRLFADIPSLRISIMAHGDYFDKANYVTKFVDLTNDATKLTDFVSKVGGTDGGDYPECYELVLRQMRTDLGWTPGTKRALVMIGDAIPHEVDYYGNTQKIDWKEEVIGLRDMGVTIYAVQCGNGYVSADEFWNHLAEQTGGKHLKLSEIKSIVDLMMAVCYREADPDMLRAYEKEVRLREGPNLAPELGNMFGSLRDDAVSEATSGAVASPVVPYTVMTPSVTPGAGSKFSRKSPKRPLEDRVDSPSKRRRHSIDSEGSTGSGSSRRSGVLGVITRARRHQMKLRPTPTRRQLQYGTSMVTSKRTRRNSGLKQRKARINRENVKKPDFLLADLPWSEWQLGMSSLPPNERSHQLWKPRHGDHIGVRNATLFHGESSRPSVYEVAVEPFPGAAKCPVACAVTPGYRQRVWDRVVLQDHNQYQVDRVLKRGCKLLVRRASLRPNMETPDNIEDNIKELRSLIGCNYDYAWKPRYDVNTHTHQNRPLCMNDIVISDNAR